MKYLIIFFGVLILAISLAMLLRPALFIELVRRYAHAAPTHIVAVLVRVVLGIALILFAGHSRFPLALQVIGWLSLLAGLIMAVIPRGRLGDLIHWVLEKFGSTLE